MALFEDGTQETPNPDATTLKEVAQALNDNIELIRQLAAKPSDLVRYKIKRINSDYTLKPWDRVISVSSGSAITITMAEMDDYTAGDWHLFLDETDNWNTYNLTIARNSNVIVGESSDPVFSTKGSLVTRPYKLIYVVTNKFVRG